MKAGANWLALGVACLLSALPACGEHDPTSTQQAAASTTAPGLGAGAAAPDLAPPGPNAACDTCKLSGGQCCGTIACCYGSEGEVCCGSSCRNPSYDDGFCCSTTWCLPPKVACVDLKCCNTTCTGTCQACSSAKKGGGTDGVCGYILSGHAADPGECPAEAQSTCGRDGNCNGAA